MAHDLKSARILVTGGASGMGAGLVRGLPRLGADVVSIDLSDAGRDVAREAGAKGFVAADVSDPASVRDAVGSAVDMLGGLDVLIHAAGIAPGAAAEAMTPDLWNMVMAVNATGTFLVNQAVFEPLRAAGGGVILNFCSAGGIKGYPGKSAYAAAKGAVAAWIRSVAVEWAPHGIRVMGIAPAIWTPMYDKTRAGMSAEALAMHDRDMAGAIPLGGRLGDIDDDLVPAIAFLASGGSRFMTGQIVPVDGGAMMMR